MDAIDEKEVACFVALKNPDEGPEAKARKESMEAQKAALTSAYAALAEALIEKDYQANIKVCHSFGPKGFVPVTQCCCYSGGNMRFKLVTLPKQTSAASTSLFSANPLTNPDGSSPLMLAEAWIR